MGQTGTGSHFYYFWWTSAGLPSLSHIPGHRTLSRQVTICLMIQAGLGVQEHPLVPVMFWGHTVTHLWLSMSRQLGEAGFQGP